MSFEIKKKPQAERDIEECFVYIGEDNLDIAVHFLVAVEDSIEEIGRNPFIGKKENSKISKIRICGCFTSKNFTNIKFSMPLKRKPLKLFGFFIEQEIYKTFSTKLVV